MGTGTLLTDCTFVTAGVVSMARMKTMVNALRLNWYMGLILCRSFRMK